MSNQWEERRDKLSDMARAVVAQVFDYTKPECLSNDGCAAYGVKAKFLDFLPAVISGLDAVREPTPEMIEAGVRELAEYGPSRDDPEAAVLMIFQAMIDTLTYPEGRTPSEQALDGSTK